MTARITVNPALWSFAESWDSWLATGVHASGRLGGKGENELVTSYRPSLISGSWHTLPHLICNGLTWDERSKDLKSWMMSLKLYCRYAMVPLETLEVHCGRNLNLGGVWKKSCKEIRLFFPPKDEELDRYGVRIRNFTHIILHHCKCHQWKLEKGNQMWEDLKMESSDSISLEN